MKALPIHAETRDHWSSVDLEALARRWNLAPYDAAYLDLALREAIPLATADDELKRVAAQVGIEILG